MPYNNFTEYANRFYTNEQAQTWYRDHIDTVLNRVNTVNGRKYNEDATIMTWQLANEPQNAVVPDEYLGEYSLELPPAPSDPLFGWIESTSAYIKAAAPNQLVNVGFEGKQGKWYYQKAHNYSTIDYGTTHCWVENWGVYGFESPCFLLVMTMLMNIAVCLVPRALDRTPSPSPNCGFC